MSEEAGIPEETFRMICPECKNAKHFVYTKGTKQEKKVVIICSNCGLITPL